MPIRTGMLLMGVVAFGVAVSAQAQTKKPSLKKMVSKIVDTTLTQAAAGAVDTLLGTKAGAESTACPPGFVMVGGTGAAASTAGGAIVNTAKKKLLGAKDSAPAGTPPRQPTCVPAAGAANAGDPAAMAQAAAAAQSQAAAGQAAAGAMPSAGSIAKGMAAATPVGLAVSAAPTAIKAVGGLLGRKAQTKESMIKDLAKGRLILKGIKFIASSDALEEPIDDDIALLAEALAAMDGQYVLNMPAEARDKEPADTAIARRRLTKLIANLQVAGISDERMAVVGIYPPGLDPKAKSPKPGDARVEVLPLPKDFPKQER
jgi:hypothetical protein